MLSKNKKIVVIAGIFLLVIIAVCLTTILIKPNKKALALHEMEKIVSSIRNSYKNSPGYWGLDSKFVINNNIASDVKDGKIVNVYGKNVFIGYDFDTTTLMPGSKTFDVVYKDLTKNECISLLSLDFSEEQKLSLIAIFLKFGDDIDEFSWGGKNKLPISVNIAKRFCKDKNDILWRFE